jgi:hypothetical protein
VSKSEAVKSVVLFAWVELEMLIRVVLSRCCEYRFAKEVVRAV